MEVVSMAHVAKYTRSAIGRLMGHYNREKDDGVNRNNESIDPERTDENYFLKSGSVDSLNERLLQVKVCKRADVNVLCDWVVTLPKDVQVDDEQKFFEAVFDFLSERYEAENIINAVVHKDETTPHMHCAFVPVVEDKKKGGYKVSAKERLNRAELQSFHTDLSVYVQERIGYEVAILNGATVEGNLTKKEMLKKDIEELEQEKGKLQGKILTVEEVKDKSFKKCFGGGIKLVKKSGEVASTSETIDYIQSLKKTASRVKSSDRERDEAVERAKKAENERDKANKRADDAENDRQVYFSRKDREQVERVRKANSRAEKAENENSNLKSYMDEIKFSDGSSVLDAYNEKMENQKNKNRSQSHGYER